MKVQVFGALVSATPSLRTSAKQGTTRESKDILSVTSKFRPAAC